MSFLLGRSSRSPPQTIPSTSITPTTIRELARDKITSATRHSFKIPEASSELPTLIENHDAHTVFKYVTLSPTNQSTKDTILSKLRSFQVGDSSEEMPFEDIKPIELIKDETEVCFSQNIVRQLEKGGRVNKDTVWWNLGELYILFDGSADKYTEVSKVEFKLYDYRKEEDQVVRYGDCNSWGRSTLFTSLDNSVHKEDFHHIVLKINNTNNVFKAGVRWGSIKIQCQIRGSKIAKNYAVIPTMGIISVDPENLGKPKRDPRSISLVYKQKDLQAMNKLFKNNQLVDFSKSEDRRKSLKGFAGSVAGSEDEDERRLAVINNWRHSNSHEEPIADKKGKKRAKSPPLKPASSIDSTSQQGEFPDIPFEEPDFIPGPENLEPPLVAGPSKKKAIKNVSLDMKPTIIPHQVTFHTYTSSN